MAIYKKRLISLHENHIHHKNHIRIEKDEPQGLTWLLHLSIFQDTRKHRTIELNMGNLPWDLGPECHWSDVIKD